LALLRLVVPTIYSPTSRQVNLNCLYIECLASAKKWMEALTACEEATKSIPNKRLHRCGKGEKTMIEIDTG
jgi:hypothetical protein